MGRFVFIAVVGILLLFACACAYVRFFAKDWDEDDPHW